MAFDTNNFADKDGRDQCHDRFIQIKRFNSGREVTEPSEGETIVLPNAQVPLFRFCPITRI